MASTEHWKNAVKDSHGVWISKSDDRVYKPIVLPNGMKVLVVSDKNTEFAAAAVACAVGSSHDPKDLQGAFHALEHFLFMGTEKFPDENVWSEKVSEWGGYSNAFTASNETNYHVQVKADKLEPTLEMFATFFSCPLFKEESVARELLAVDSEHAKNVQSDSWRLYQLDKSTSHPDHSYSNFGTGDTRTLRDIPKSKGIDTRAEVVKLHKQHYSAGRMSVAILGRESIDVLESWVRKHFSCLENNGSTMPVVHRHPYAGLEPTVYYAVPVKDTRSVSIIWQLPEEEHLYPSKPSNYISHLIGHEGPGSILSFLKARGLALGLSCGPDTTPGYTSFEIGIDLTEAGLAAVNEVVAAVYAYVGLLRAVGVQERVFDEEAKQSSSSVRFLSKSGPIHTVTSLASSLLTYPKIEDTVVGHRMYREFKPDEISERLKLFEPENSRIRIVSQAASVADRCNLTEKWYGTRYGEEKMSEALIGKWKAAASAYESFVCSVGPEKHRPSSDADSAATAGSADSNAAPTLELLASDPDAWARAIKPVLAIPDPNDFIATDFRLRNSALGEKQALAESSLGMSMGGDEEGGDDGDEEEEEEEGGGDGDGAKDSAAVDLTASLIPARRKREPIPILLRDDKERSIVWFNQDAFFGSPKLYLHADLALPAAYASPTSYVLTDLFVRLLNDSLNEFSYAAELADLRYRVQVTVNGLSLYVGGFSHKLHVLVEKLAQRCRELTFTDSRFAMHKDRALRAYQNWDKEQPVHHAIFNNNLATMTPLWTAESKLDAAKLVTADSLRAFQGMLLSQCFVTCLVSGNATADEALHVAEALIKPLASKEKAPLPVYPGQASIQRVSRLPLPLLLTTTPLASAAGVGAALTGHGASRFTKLCWEFHHSQTTKNPEDPNSALEMVVQIGPSPSGPLARQTAMFRLAAHILSEPFFDILRTKQQLGYLCSASMKLDGQVRSLRFLIQSNKVSGQELLKRTEAFLGSYMTTFLKEMDAAKFRSNVAGVIAKVNEQDKNASEEANVLWGQISEQRFDFSRARYVTDALAEVKQDEFCEWFREHIQPGGTRRRVLVSIIEPTITPVGAADEAASAALVNAAKAAEEPLDAHSVNKAAEQAVAVASADQGTASAGAASPAAGTSTTAVASPVTGSEVVREDAVGTGAAIAAEAKGAVTAEEEAGKTATEEVAVRVSPAQAGLVFSALSSADISEGGGGAAVPDHLLPLVFQAFADAGVGMEGFVKQAKQRGLHTIKIVVEAKTPEDIRSALPLYPHFSAIRLEALREGLIKMEKPEIKQ